MQCLKTEIMPKNVWSASLKDAACLFLQREPRLQGAAKEAKLLLKWPLGWEIYHTTCTLVKRDHLLPFYHT